MWFRGATKPGTVSRCRVGKGMCHTPGKKAKQQMGTHTHHTHLQGISMGIREMVYMVSFLFGVWGGVDGTGQTGGVD